MISDAMKRLARAVGLTPAGPASPVYRDPRTGDRTAVLRPKDTALSLRRLEEWNTAMDRALDAPSLEQGRKVADAVWLTMKQEQPWTFLGWLAIDLKTVLDDDGQAVDRAAPGDMHEAEAAMKRWKR